MTSTVTARVTVAYLEQLLATLDRLDTFFFIGFLRLRVVAGSLSVNWIPIELWGTPGRGYGY